MDDEPDYVDVEQRIEDFRVHFGDAMKCNAPIWAWLDGDWQPVQVESYEPFTDRARVFTADHKGKHCHAIEPDLMWASANKPQGSKERVIP